MPTLREEYEAIKKNVDQDVEKMIRTVVNYAIKRDFSESEVRRLVEKVLNEARGE